MRIASLLLASGFLLAPPGLRAQERLDEAPPPGGITPMEHNYALTVGLGSLNWDEVAPYDDLILYGFGVERHLWNGIRGRARLGIGETELRGDLLEDGATDVTVILIDLQVVFAPEFGRLEKATVLPYVVAGLGSVVTDPSHEEEQELQTETHSQWSLGGGVRARVFRRWELAAEATTTGQRLLDPFDPENRDTETIHNLRWEGRISWLF